MENLLEDKKFVNKRIKEQNDYISDLSKRFTRKDISEKRFIELVGSALNILDNFEAIKYGRNNPPLQ